MSHNVEAGMAYSFSDKAMEDHDTTDVTQLQNISFIRKVYAILFVQLVVTFGMVMLFTYVQSIRNFTYHSTWLYWLAFALTFACLFAIVRSRGIARKTPINFVFLGIFTVCEGFMLGCIAARFDSDSVMLAVGITALVSLALTLFAFQTKIDFTMCSGFLFVLLITLSVFGFCMIFAPSSKYAMIGYGTLGAFVFSLYIVFDTQLIMGGKHMNALDPEEYVFATLSLYLDIINLFVYFLIIIGAVSRN